MSNERYLISCPCGGEARVKGAAAGTEIACPLCNTPILLPRLTELRRYRSVICDDEPAWLQFSLADIMFSISTIGAGFGYSRLTNAGYGIVLVTLAIYARLLVKHGSKPQRVGGFALFAFGGLLILAAVLRQL